MLEFVEGTLPANLSAAMARHIRECPSCMQELESQSSRTRALQKIGRVQAPDQWREISTSIRRAGWAYFVRRYGVPAVGFGITAAGALAAAAWFLGPIVEQRAGAVQRGGQSVSVASAGIGGGQAAAMADRPAEAPPAGEKAAAGAEAHGATGGQAGAAKADAGEYDALEADHYDKMVGQFLDDGTATATARDGSSD
jgi:hypothetical protein